MYHEEKPAGEVGSKKTREMVTYTDSLLFGVASEILGNSSNEGETEWHPLKNPSISSNLIF